MQEVKDDILRLVMDRAPNTVRKEIISRHLTEYSDKDVEKALRELVQKGKLESPLGHTGDSRAMVQAGYKLPADMDVPIRMTIQVGDVPIFRILQSDMIQLSLEDINEAIESLARYSETMESRSRELIREERRKYWANLIPLFGIFVAMFSFILISLPRIETSMQYSFWKTLEVNTAQILPVAIILALFVAVLRLVFR